MKNLFPPKYTTLHFFYLSRLSISLYFLQPNIHSLSLSFSSTKNLYQSHKLLWRTWRKNYYQTPQTLWFTFVSEYVIPRSNTKNMRQILIMLGFNMNISSLCMWRCHFSSLMIDTPSLSHMLHEIHVPNQLVLMSKLQVDY